MMLLIDYVNACKISVVVTRDYGYFSRSFKAVEFLKMDGRRSFGLVTNNCIVASYDMMPMSNHLSDESIDSLDDDAFAVHMATIDHFVERTFCDAQIGHELVSEAIAMGYKQEDDGFIGLWVMHEIFKLVTRINESE